MITESPYPIKGRSEVVFGNFPVKPLTARSLRFGGSLWHISIAYSSLQRFVVFCMFDFRPFFVICKEVFYLFVFSAAFFVLFAASTWTRIVWIDFFFLYDGA